MTICNSDDYAYMSINDLDLYYGWENHFCDKHGFDSGEECDGGDDCIIYYYFSARLNDELIFRHMDKKESLNYTEPVDGLLSGLSAMIQDELLKLNVKN